MPRHPRCRRVCSSRPPAPEVELEVFAGLARHLVPDLRDRRRREQEREHAVVDAVRVALDEREGEGGAGLPTVAGLAPRAAGAHREVPHGASGELQPAGDGHEMAAVLHELHRERRQVLARLDAVVVRRVLHLLEAARGGHAVQGERALEGVQGRRGGGGQGERGVGHGCRRRGARGELGGGEHRAGHCAGAGEGVAGDGGGGRGRCDAEGGERGCREGAAQEEGKGTTHEISFDPFVWVIESVWRSRRRSVHDPFGPAPMPARYCRP